MRFIAGVLNKMIILIIISLIILGYSIIIEPNLLKINKMEIGTLTKAEVRVVQFSDTHLGNHYTARDLEKLVRVINNQNPDIVVFTGDMIDSVKDSKYPQEILKTLKKLDANLVKVAVFGNHDYGLQGYKYYENMMQGAGFKVLVNESVMVNASGGVKINIVGLDEALLGNPDYKKVSSLITKTDYDILVMHEPDEISHFEQDSYQLALAGHSHGGQVRIPLIGEIATPLLAKKYVKGMYEITNEKKIYVSSGIGTTVLPIRFMNIPEIAVIDIKI